MAEERLQKILARAGVASRRKAEELIAAGLVTINGRVAALGDKADVDVDAVKIEGRRVPPPVPHRYLVLNKPVGYVSTVADPEGRPTVLDLVPPGLRKALVPVGRLDFQSEGLLLLTTDGEWAQRIAHPRYGCAKVYEAKVRALPEEREIERLRRGMWIEGKRTLPAEVRLLRTTARSVAPGRRTRTSEKGRETGNSWWEVVLREGRSRQIRDMFFRIGHGVLKLRRVAVGPLRDDELPLGAWRELTPEEVEQLRRAGKVSARLQGRRPEEEDGEGREEAPRPRGRSARGAGTARPRDAARQGAAGSASAAGPGGAGRPGAARAAGAAGPGRAAGPRPPRPGRPGGRTGGPSARGTAPPAAGTTTKPRRPRPAGGKPSAGGRPGAGGKRRGGPAAGKGSRKR